jgi:hypothetical protein
MGRYGSEFMLQFILADWGSSLQVIGLCRSHIVGAQVAETCASTSFSE